MGISCLSRLLNGDAVKEAIARGVRDGIIAYIGKTSDGKYEPFHYQVTISTPDIEISEDVFIITQETVETYKQALANPNPDTPTSLSQIENGETIASTSIPSISLTEKRAASPWL